MTAYRMNGKRTETIMFKINNKTISITRGDTGIFTLTIKNGDNDYDYSNDTVKFTVKESTTAAEPLIQKTVVYGQNIVIEPSDTANLKYGDYVYDVQLTTSGGIVDTVIVPSKFVVLPEVTF